MALPHRLVPIAVLIALALGAPAAERRRAAPKPDQSRFCDYGTDVPGVTLPADFCIRKFATLPTPRVMLFAPNGDLFVSSPRRRTPGGAPPGSGAIYVLRESNPVTVQKFTFADTPSFESVHGLLIKDGRFYYTLENGVFSVPYQTGETRISADAPEQVADLTPAVPLLARWTHSLAASTSGSIFVSRGQFDNNTCPPADARSGAVLRVGSNADAKGTIVADGMRDPLFIRCMPWSRCYAAELSGDGWAAYGGHEKLVELADGDHYGYPCCVEAGVPSPEASSKPDCTNIAGTRRTFQLHDTPFGFDWERGVWPEKYRGAFFVALHGEFNTWIHAALRWAPVDPQTHLPTQDVQDFALGFGRAGAIPRPTDLLFAPDGRLFFTDDTGGAIYWIAPRTLRRK